MINMKKEPAATQCAFSCQAGRGRTTLGIAIQYDIVGLHLWNSIFWFQCWLLYSFYFTSFCAFVKKTSFDLNFFSSGMVVACLVKEIQICTELRKMAEMGLIQSEVVRRRCWNSLSQFFLKKSMTPGRGPCQAEVWIPPAGRGGPGRPLDEGRVHGDAGTDAGTSRG